MRHILCSILLAGSALAPVPAAAQSAGAELQHKLDAMQAEIDRLSAQVDDLKAQVRAAQTPAPAPAPAAAPAAAGAAAVPATVAPAPSPAPAADKAISVAWKGAPEITAPGGWSFKPRGRLQIDSAVVAAPAGIPGNETGIATEFRRAFVGMEGTLPGGFGYRMEADVANSSVELTDVFLTYKASKDLTLTVGQHKPFTGIEELTSDLFTSMRERAAFTSAFGFERRVGLSGTYAHKDLIVQFGAFTDNAADLNNDGNNSYSIDGRVVFAPKIGDGVLHVAGAAHYRDLNDASSTVRYRARPFTHTTDLRLVDTGAFSATGERNFGAELAWIQGPFHATAEGHWMTALRPGLANASFWGGYVEVGMLVTPGDKTAYRAGAYDRIRPVNPVSDGGIGAIQINARYDRVDLTDGAIVGGQQQTGGVSVIWIPTDYVRFLVDYGHLWIDDAAVPAGTDTEYQVDTFGLRAQFDF